MANNLEQKILAGFAKEVEFYLPQIRENLEIFLTDSSQHDALEAAYRPLHTIHGAAAMMGLAVLSHMAAYLEAALGAFLHAQRPLDDAWGAWLRHSVLTLEQYIHGLLAEESAEATVIATMVQAFRRLSGLPEAADADAIALVLSGQPATLEVSAPIRLRTEAMIRDGLGLPDEWAMPPAPSSAAESITEGLEDIVSAGTPLPEAAQEPPRLEVGEPTWAAYVDARPADAADVPSAIVAENAIAAAFPEALTPEEALSAEPGLFDDLLTTVDEEIRQTYGQLSLASPWSPAMSTAAERYVLFTLAGTRYAIAVSAVLEISRVPAITYVPNVPPWIRGVTNLRGEILSVIDFRLFLGIAAPGALGQSRLLVVQALDQDLTTSLIVDQVNGLIPLASPRLAVPESALSDKLAPYLRGVYDHNSQFLAVFDLESWLASEDVRQFE